MSREGLGSARITDDKFFYMVGMDRRNKMLKKDSLLGKIKS